MAEDVRTERGADTAAPAPQPPPATGLGSRFLRLWTAVTFANLGQGASAIAFPWLATTLTDNALAIALVGAAVRLPWLLFSLPAGALADRLDRRRIMLAMSAARVVVLGTVALLVALDVMSLPLLYVCALVLGFAEVLFDNTSQVLLPSLVDRDRLAAANGRLMAGQIVTEDFFARPVGGFLLGLALAAPFAFDALTAAVAGVLLLTLRGTFRAAAPAVPAQTTVPSAVPAQTGQDAQPTAPAPPVVRRRMRADIAEGVRWLWRHPLLRPLALSLAVLNVAGQGIMATYVLYAQEVLDLGAFGFAVLTSVGGVGGLLGGLLAARVTRRIGTARSLFCLLAIDTVAYTTAVLSSDAYLVGAAMAVTGFGIVMWNVVTVSLRQTLIPDHLLGRVNSVYRLLGWGSMPLGMAAVGGLVVAVEALAGREAGLRTPYVVALVCIAGLSLYMRRHLRQRSIDAALGTRA
ncbi:MFS transporter [Streptomyces avicenniae]|uniref:MFS transporter n=1 Tax=Streptomyces avicenniae TaxID=500153 RepID=UPI00069A9450|nr:MFS transporter [Streptomyces avicenniae]